MKHLYNDYYIYNNELYRKVKMTKQGYHLKCKDNKLRWITLDKILEYLANK